MFSLAKNQKVVKYKKSFQFQPDFLKIIFLLVILYILFLFISYSNKEHVSIYEVNQTKIADDTTLKGIILRTEKIVTSKQGGYINYFNPEGNKVAVGDVIYTVDSTGNVADTLADMGTSSKITDDEINNLRDVISKYQTNFNPAQYNSIYDYQFDVKNTVFEQTKENLYSDLEKVLSEKGQSDTFQKVTAKRSGIISYSIDGFEDLQPSSINADTFSKELSMTKSQLRTTNSVAENSPVYKLITSEEWKLVVPLSAEYYDKLKDKTTVRVKVKKDNISFNANLSIEQKDDGYYGTLSMSRFMQRYMDDRFLEIELNLNSAQGLKIPNSSIVKESFYYVDASYASTTPENANSVLTKVSTSSVSNSNLEYVNLNNHAILYDNKYYLEKGLLKPGETIVNQTTGDRYTIGPQAQLEGVYCVNEGYCKFVRIEKEYENSEYTIVSPATANGLAEFDHIVVNPDTLNDNDFIQ